MIIGNIVRMWNSPNIEVRLTKPVDVMTSLLPEDAQTEIPVGFAIVGHIGTFQCWTIWPWLTPAQRI